MSRIDEALRRAAEEQTTTDGIPRPDVPAPVEGDEVASLAREPFPGESAETRRARLRAAVGNGAGGTRSGAAHGGATHTAAENGEEGPRTAGRTLFERIDARLAEKVVADSNMSAVSREQYRRLAAVLHDAQGNNGLTVVMIASAMPGEGKTLTASNVALTLSDSYRRRVLLIDADLRKPALHHVFRLNAASGLIDGLEAEAETKLVLRQVSSHLWVLPAGRPTTDPMAALTSERMRRLLAEARETFDWVIIDTPPLGMLSDAHLLSPMVDGAVLVIRAKSTPHELVRRTVEVIGRNLITGVVLNHADLSLHTRYGYGGYGGYYLPSSPKPAEPRP